MQMWREKKKKKKTVVEEEQVCWIFDIYIFPCSLLSPRAYFLHSMPNWTTEKVWHYAYTNICRRCGDGTWAETMVFAFECIYLKWLWFNGDDTLSRRDRLPCTTTHNRRPKYCACCYARRSTKEETAIEALWCVCAQNWRHWMPAKSRKSLYNAISQVIYDFRVREREQCEMCQTNIFDENEMVAFPF